MTKGGAKLLDFGVAKLRTTASQTLASAPQLTATAPVDLTRAGSVVGTPRYMAPEVLEGRDADARSDVFALGAILREMATGSPAFSATSHAALVAEIISAEASLEQLQARRRWDRAPGEDLPGQGPRRSTPERPRRQAPARMARRGACQERRHARTFELAPLAMDRSRSVVLGLTTWAAWSLTGVNATREPMRVSILAPDVMPAMRYPSCRPMAGVAFVARGPTGEPALWIRPLDLRRPY